MEKNQITIDVNSDEYRNRGIVPQNPVAEAMLAKMTPEEVAEYKQFGEHMYGGFDYEKGASTTEYKEAMLYIKIALRSGLHPDNLSDDEKAFMKEEFGEKWAENWEEHLEPF